MTSTGIGAPVRRREDFRFITGKGQYTDDINRAGQAHAYFLRSPHAHATINRLDASAARATPGVLAVLTGEDLAADTVGTTVTPCPSNPPQASTATCTPPQTTEPTSSP